MLKLLQKQNGAVFYASQCITIKQTDPSYEKHAKNEVNKNTNEGCVTF